jgi:D-alanine--poly(phosphoribitol) ligase subunit 1
LNILKQIQSCAQQDPDRIAVRSGEDALSYGQLWEYSGRLALWLLKHADAEKTSGIGEWMSEERNPGIGECAETECHPARGKYREAERYPVAVYGHKHPWILVCFLACVRSGRAYCPIDISVPDARVEAILRELPSGLVLTTETLGADAGEKRVIDREMLAQILDSGAPKQDAEKEQRTEAGTDTIRKCDNGSTVRNASQLYENDLAVSEDPWVRGDETYYIIFTSGSTGTPKGVQITADCLNHYLDWSVTLGSSAQEKQGQVFLNQAPFSFDLSVMDLYTSLACGGTLYCLSKKVQSDYRALVQALQESGANVWVSTPSFAEICLSERAFSEELMPDLQTFLFCGETLANKTAQRLQQRFPKAKIINTYGPTESTVAVTDVRITPELAAQEEALPVGRSKPGTNLEIRDEDGQVLPDGEKGEIIILGDTVSTGYFGRPDLTEKSFFMQDGVRGYHTGDKGYLLDGMLYYCGRIDLQIKLHGYRIELEDIENNIARLPQVEQVVVVPNSRGGKVTSLTAYVVKRENISDDRAYAAKMREDLQQFLPDYMIPKKFVFLERMPMTNNGKADRKLLAAGLAEGKTDRTSLAAGLTEGKVAAGQTNATGTGTEQSGGAGA